MCEMKSVQYSLVSTSLTNRETPSMIPCFVVGFACSSSQCFIAPKTFSIGIMSGDSAGQVGVWKCTVVVRTEVDCSRTEALGDRSRKSYLDAHLLQTSFRSVRNVERGVVVIQLSNATEFLH